MIFRPDMIDLIRARRKTQTRRPVTRHPEWGFEMPCRYEPGRVYKVQHTPIWTPAHLRVHQRICERTQPTRARAVAAYLTEPLQAELTAGRAITTDIIVTVLEVRRETLGEITKQDVKREGFKVRADFEARWRRLHRSYDPDLAVWVISFEVGDKREHFDQLRLLKATPGHTSETGDVEEHQDYTDRPDLAMFGEPEGLTERQLKPYVTQARDRDRMRRHQERVATPLAERVRSIEARARSGDQEAKRALFVIGQRVEKAEQRQAREAAA